MPKHVKPTKEELAEQEKLAVEEAEKLSKETPEEPEEIDEEELERKTKEEAGIEEEEPEEPEEAEPSEEEKEKLKTKLSASARENQKIYAKNRVINKALSEAEDIPEPSDEELKTEFEDWELMTGLEKKLAKESIVSKKWRTVISQAKEQATKIERWNDSVEEFVSDPKTLSDNPELEGKVDNFREFATTEENNSVPMKILISAFLHEQSSGKQPSKGRMFETGSGGPNDKPTPKNNKISLEEARQLRTTDYDKYKRYLAEDRIELNV